MPCVHGRLVLFLSRFLVRFALLHGVGGSEEQRGRGCCNNDDDYCALMHDLILISYDFIPRYQVMQGICELAIEALVKAWKKIQHRVLGL